MDETLRAILETLPSKRHQSKLDPHGALIRALRRRGRSYREIVALLRERFDIHVGLHTVYRFVRKHSQKKQAMPREHQSPQGSPQAASTVTDDVRTRIAAVKAPGAPATAAAAKEFAYDENEPLQLITRGKSKRERA
jgi:IS30 family transposase